MTLIALFQPSRPTLLILRIVMIPVVLGGLLGMFEHIENNLAFTREISQCHDARGFQ
ncbi:MAG: hypothetical protein R3C44_15040 [Chloroflexota bacterium]